MSRLPTLAATVRRASWIGLDQIVSSASNFALTVVVARQSSPQAFADFGVVIGAYFVVLALVRALASDPFVIFSAVASEERRSELRRWSISSSLLVGLVTAIFFGIAGTWWADGRELLYPMVACIVMLALHEHLRQILIAENRVAIPLAADSVWLVGFLALLGLVDSPSQVTTLWFWTMTGVAAAVVSLLGSRLSPELTNFGQWGREIRRVGWSYSIQLFVGAIWWQLVALAALVYASTERAAGIRGAGVLLAVGSLGSTVIVATAFPSIAHAARTDFPRLRKLVLVVVAGVVSSVMIVAAVVGVFPDALGVELLGESWPATSNELLFATSTFVAMGVAAVVSLVLRASQRLVAGVIVMGGTAGAIIVATAATATWSSQNAGFVVGGIALLACFGALLLVLVRADRQSCQPTER